jgi:hypothetical protein
VASRWESRREREANFAEVKDAANLRLLDTDQDVERLEALAWAAQNGVQTKWLDGSLKKLQRDRVIRAAGYDPDKGTRLSEDSTGLGFRGLLGWGGDPQDDSKARPRKANQAVIDDQPQQFSDAAKRALRRMDTEWRTPEQRAKDRAERRKDVRAQRRRIARREKGVA